VLEGRVADTAAYSKRTEPQLLPGVQQVEEPGFRHDVPDAQQADPQDADWLQQCPALQAAFVGHTCTAVSLSVHGAERGRLGR